MPTVNAGTTTTVPITSNDSVRFDVDPGEVVNVQVFNASGVSIFSSPILSTRIIGPFPVGSSMTITAARGNADYEIVDQELFGAPAMIDAQNRLVGPGGVVLDAVAIRRQSKRPIKLALLGDSRSASATVAGTSTRGDWLPFALALSGSGARLVLNAGVSGDTTVQAAARVQQVIDSGADVCTLLVGTNDNAGWTTKAQVDASLAARRSITDQLTAAGVYVLSISEMPGAGYSAAWHDLAAYFNAKEAEYWAGRTDGEFVDVWSRMTVSSTGLGNTAYFQVEAQQKHPNTLGAWRAAPPVAEAIKRVSSGRVVRLLLNSTRDTYATSSNSRNIHQNGLCVGTTGTIGAGNTGQLPTSWASDVLSTATCAYSVVARADEVGNDLRAVVSATSGQQAYLNSGLNHALMTVGSQWVIRAELVIEAATNLNELSLTVATGGWSFMTHLAIDTASGITVTTPTTMLVESMVHTVASAPAWAQFRVFAKFVSGQSGSCTFRLGRVSVERVDGPIA